MNNYLLIVFIILLLIPKSTFAQQARDSILFSDALQKHLNSFKKESQSAYNNKDFVRGRYIFDSLVKHHLVNTFFDDFKVKKVNGRLINLNSYYKKPIVLMTNTLWCYKSNEEIAAINELVKVYHKEIDFVALYWSDKKSVRSDSKKYSSLVHITYINDKMNLFSKELKHLKHAFGFPTYFFVDKDKKVSNIIKLRPLSPIQKEKGRLKINEDDFNSYKSSLNILINKTIDSEFLAIE